MYQAHDKPTSNPTKRTHTRLMTIILCIIVLIALILGFLFLGSRNSGGDDATAPKSTVKSMFSFGGAEDWHQGPTTANSMALFSPADHSGMSPCLVSAQYYNGAVNTATQQDTNRKTLAQSGATVTNVGTQHLSMHTSSGTKKYDLEQYSVTTPEGQDNPVMGGNELGFVKISGGYLKITGKCDTADQLPSTLPALKALKFNIHAIDS